MKSANWAGILCSTNMRILLVLSECSIHPRFTLLSCSSSTSCAWILNERSFWQMIYLGCMHAIFSYFRTLSLCFLETHSIAFSNVFSRLLYKISMYFMGDWHFLCQLILWFNFSADYIFMPLMNAESIWSLCWIYGPRSLMSGQTLQWCDLSVVTVRHFQHPSSMQPPTITSEDETFVCKTALLIWWACWGVQTTVVPVISFLVLIFIVLILRVPQNTVICYSESFTCCSCRSSTEIDTGCVVTFWKDMHSSRPVEQTSRGLDVVSSCVIWQYCPVCVKVYSIFFILYSI